MYPYIYYICLCVCVTVIDFCLTKNLMCDQETNYTSLHLQWASKANCEQRKGRAGRVSHGRVYRMVTRRFYDEHIPEYGIPEMQVLYQWVLPVYLFLVVKLLNQCMSVIISVFINTFRPLYFIKHIILSNYPTFLKFIIKIDR